MDIKYLQALDHLSRTDLRYFVPRVFAELNPEEKLEWNWHLDVMCWNLMRTLPASINPTPNARLRRLIINVPPRSLKSIICSVALSAFLLGHFPHHKIIGASYSGKLASKMNIDVMRVMNSAWYKRLFPHTIFDKEAEGKLTTTRNGHRIAASVGGTITGEGAETIIADDLLNADDVNSKIEVKGANTWFDSSLSTRLNNPKESVIIVVMQRLDVEDLTGHLLEKNKLLAEDKQWKIMCLPAVFDKPPEKPFKYYSSLYLPKAGELLHEARLDHETLNAKKVDLGSKMFAGQFLQQPFGEQGNMVDLAWFKRYSDVPAASDITGIVQSWDTAVKDGDDHDYSVCITWAETKNGFYILDIQYKKLEYPYLLAWVQEMYDIWRPASILIEDKASGQSLLQDLRRNTQLPVYAINPEKDKVTRLAAVSAVIESGRVFLPYKSAWLADFEMQIMAFPNGKNDDMVDAFSQYLNWRRGRGVLPRISVIGGPVNMASARPAATENQNSPVISARISSLGAGRLTV